MFLNTRSDTSRAQSDFWPQAALFGRFSVQMKIGFLSKGVYSWAGSWMDIFQLMGSGRSGCSPRKTDLAVMNNWLFTVPLVGFCNRLPSETTNKSHQIAIKVEGTDHQTHKLLNGQPWAPFESVFESVEAVWPLNSHFRCIVNWVVNIPQNSKMVSGRIQFQDK